MAEPSGEGERRIVVGVDGSDSSKAALAWAVKQARYTGAAVEAVTAWEFGLTYGFPPSAAFDVDYAGIAEMWSPMPSPESPARASRSRSDPWWRRATRLRCCWMRRRGLSFWWSAAEGVADSPGPCSARPASTARSTPPVPSW